MAIPRSSLGGQEIVTAMRGDATSTQNRLVPRPLLVHSARTAVAAATSLLVAQLFRLSEAYWAPITTLVIEQSSLGAAFAVSWSRLIGTMLGAAIGTIVASQWSGRYGLTLSASVFVLGLLR
jgi:uncharacterized membrane protein YccC